MIDIYEFYHIGDRVELVSESMMREAINPFEYTGDIWIPEEMIKDLAGRCVTIDGIDTNYFNARGWMIPYCFIKGYTEDKTAKPSVNSSDIDDILKF